MKTFVIADLHGRYDLLDRAIESIQSYGATPQDTVVLLGDYIDRGPDSRKIVERLIKAASLDSPERQKWIILKGNHEDILVRTCRKPLKMGWWLGNGGGSTLISYGLKEGDPADPFVIPEAHVAFLEQLPKWHLDNHRVYVHAGCQKMVALSQQSDHDLMWNLYRDDDEGGYLDTYHVVHGHHHHIDGPLLYSRRSNFDTCAYYYGYLVVGVFDDAVPGGPVDTIQILGKPGWDE